MQTEITKIVSFLLLAVVLSGFSNGVWAADTVSPNDKEQADEELIALEKLELEENDSIKRPIVEELRNYRHFDRLVEDYDYFKTSFNLIDLNNDGYGEAKGFELFWRDSNSFESIDYWLSYSFLDTKRKYDIFPYPVMPYYASNHNLSIVYK